MHNITSEYDIILNALVIKMPEYVKYSDLTTWQSELLFSLNKFEHQISLLIDTNLHNFESIECLKLLRSLFDRPIVKEKIAKAAFISPKQYKKPEIVSDKEAYFNKFEEAYKWLK